MFCFLPPLLEVVWALLAPWLVGVGCEGEVEGREGKEVYVCD